MSKQSGGNKIGVLFMQSQTYFGSDSMIHSLIMRELDRSRFEVHAAVNRGTKWDPSASLPALRKLPGIRIRPTSFGTSINFRSWRQKLRDTLLNGPRSLVSLVGLAIYARRNKIKIIHGTEKPRDAFYGYLLKKVTGARTIVHLHVGVNHEWMLGLTQKAMRNASGLLAVSEYVETTAVKAGYDPKRCYHVVNAIDGTKWDPNTSGATIREEFGIAEHTKVLSLMSRVNPWKGHRELLKALAKVKPEFDDFVFLLVGEDDIRATPGHTSFLAELHELVPELGLQDHVIFTGFRTDIANLLAASDIYAMPSFEEPCAVAYLEAMAMATPIIAYASPGGGGTSQMVDHGKAGLLSEAYNIDELAANILWMLRNDEQRVEMGKYARRRVEEYYTPARIAADTAVVYDKVLSGPR